MSELNPELTPERAARILRAKAGQLENAYISGANVYPSDLAADLALVASLLAELWERLGDEVKMVPIDDPLFNEDGTPWKPLP